MEVDILCYLGSIVTNSGRSEKDIKTRIGKANAVFGRLNNVWKNKRLCIRTKIRLYEALVLWTLRYGAETWSMTFMSMTLHITNGIARYWVSVKWKIKSEMKRSDGELAWKH